jgi:hypothetical protein
MNNSDFGVCSGSNEEYIFKSIGNKGVRKMSNIILNDNDSHYSKDDWEKDRNSKNYSSTTKAWRFVN